MSSSSTSTTPRHRAEQGAIELPLRMLVWREGEDVLLGYRDPRELSNTYDVAGHQGALEQMARLLEELAAEAAGETAGEVEVEQAGGATDEAGV